MRKPILFVLACLLIAGVVYIPQEADSAATVTWTRLKDYDPEDVLYRATVTFDDTYAPYGEVIDARPYMTSINYAMVESMGDGGFLITINDSLYSTGYLKLQVWPHINTGDADTLAFLDAPPGYDASAASGVTVLISGKQ